MSLRHDAARCRRPERPPQLMTRGAAFALLTVGSVAASLLGTVAVPASAAGGAVVAAVSGGTGTITASGTVFAKAGGALTITVTADADTRCLSGVPAEFSGPRTATAGRSTWTFSGAAAAGDGRRTFTVAASPSTNTKGDCTGQAASTTASYISDNTGPVVTATLSPAANAAGWNRTDTTVAWTAIDGALGAGVASGPTPASSTETANGVVTRTSSATDRLGNAGSGSVEVRVDKAAPTVTALQTRNADGSVLVTFVCDDSSSGGQQSSGVATCLAAGSTTNSVLVRSSSSVTGTATDKAGNSRSTTVAVEAGDTTPPTLSGEPTTAPNPAGWYRGDVTVRWAASDPQSGVPSAPADTTITGEGAALTSSATVRNGAGLTTTATSAPPVNIDRTAPTTAVSGTSNAWTNGDVTLRLTAGDNLSGVASTQYAVDGGQTQEGTAVTLSAEGEHTVSYRTTDRAGNVEALQTAVVRIDKSAPTIRHELAPSSYSGGAWTNQDVTVTFVCADQGGSGVADCTAPVTKGAEGAHLVTGTARDSAGNSATDSASVRIDKTEPALTATVVGTKNPAGWYPAPVTVHYAAHDDLSGVTEAPAPAVLGEGRGQSATATVTDAAGNSASASVSGIDVDTTPPVLTASVPAGWHTDDVTVTWACSDVLSGVAAGPADSLVSGEGSNLSASASCTDAAGNTALHTVDGIRIDRSAPTTTVQMAEAPASGWYGDAVAVTLIGADNLAGTVKTSYRIDGGPVQTYTGPFQIGEGAHTVSFWSEDAAGNAEQAGAPLVVKVDRTAPVTTVVNPLSPDSGWFVARGIPVEFAAADGGSGIKGTYFRIDAGPVRTYGEPFTEDLSTGTHTITYWSEDLAGNVEDQGATNTVAVNVDTDAPSIRGSVSPAANGFGWHNTDVAVTFSCDDIGSGLQTGVAGCAGDTVLANDGADQSVRGDAVDVAGNRSSTQVTGIDIDKTRPTLVGVLPDPNGAGWYRDDVKVTWVGDDGLSGIDPATQPGSSAVTGEGAALGAGPVIIRDKAGNASAPATVTGIRIDRTPPAVSGAPTTAPVNGWYRDEVTVDFACIDTLSGVAYCPTSKLVKGDGANQSVTADPARDLAGNLSAPRTVGGISIDGSAPSTTANNACTAENGWCKGETADVVLTAADQAGLSGVKEIRYSVDGGAEQVVVGASATVRVPLSGSGAGTVRYYAIDHAGNKEPVNAVALKWDNIAPTVTHTVTPGPNAGGWNNSDVTVGFVAKDDDSGSGVASVSAPVKVVAETAGQVVTGTAKDAAGNVGSDSVTVKLDKTRPVISGAVSSGGPTTSGWYAGPVTVTFTCSDALSGVATCPDPVVLSANGPNAATGTVTDRAGNTATASVTGISIDQERPTLTTADVNVQGGTYTLGAVPAATCTASDSFSGLVGCVVKVSTSTANGVGTSTYTATATDKVGNTATVSGSFTVVYGFSGFLQPINDTAHQVGASTSIFKAGSTVPVKLQLRRSDGTLVQAAVVPTWLTPVKGTSTSAPVDESVYTTNPDSGTSFRYDATGQHYVYNYRTGTGGSYWRIGVRLDDGRTYYANIGLR